MLRCKTLGYSTVARVAAVLYVLAQVGCASLPSDMKHGVPQRLTLDALGTSALMQFTTSDDCRSVAILVQGEADAVYALDFLRVDEKILIDTPVGDASGRLHEAYTDERQGRLTAAVPQYARLGTFTLTYPYAVDQSVPKVVQFRVMGSQAGGQVKVTAFAVQKINRHSLHVRLFRVSEKATDVDLDTAVAHAREILRQAGITLVVDAQHLLLGSDFSRITETDGPWPSPVGKFAQLVVAARAALPGAGVAVLVVDRLPRGMVGDSLALPGPPDATDPYYGVVLQYAQSSALGRNMAHELAHFLGLHHPRSVTMAGEKITDGPTDAIDDLDNLMNSGEHLSAGQISVLQLSPLLQFP